MYRIRIFITYIRFYTFTLNIVLQKEIYYRPRVQEIQTVICKCLRQNVKTTNELCYICYFLSNLKFYRKGKELFKHFFHNYGIYIFRPLFFIRINSSCLYLISFYRFEILIKYITGENKSKLPFKDL